MNETPTDFEMRVLMLAPTPRDGEITHQLLVAEGIRCMVCRDIAEFIRQIPLGAGSLLVTEEMLRRRKLTACWRCSTNNQRGLICRSSSSCAGVRNQHRRRE